MILQVWCCVVDVLCWRQGSNFCVTESEAIQIMIEHMQGLFPKTCPGCQRRFESLRDFYLNTTPEGTPVSKDLEADILRPLRPLGAAAVSTCKCGASISITSDGMPLFRLWSLLLWAKTETIRRDITSKELLQDLRAQIRQRVVAEGQAKRQRG